MKVHTPGPRTRSVASTLALVVLILCRLPAGATEACVAPDDGTGTVEIPPANCAWVTLGDPYRIIDGLPPGTTIELEAIHQNVFCLNTPCGQPGGNLGGEEESYDEVILFELTGTGDLAGFDRLLTLPVSNISHSAPRTPGDAVQAFATDMFQMQGALIGDPDFDFLQITAGTNFGRPSPGFTTLTRLGPAGSDFEVDSFFDISYQIDFQGAPGSVLEGLSGSTQETTRIDQWGCACVLNLGPETASTDRTEGTGGTVSASDYVVDAIVEFRGCEMVLGENFKVNPGKEFRAVIDKQQPCAG